MKYAPLFLLLAASSVQANDWGWEWKRQPVTAEDYCEIKRIARLTPQTKYQLDVIAESERDAFNHQTMMQYNRALPIPLPLMPTPEVAWPRRGPLRFFHSQK
jgi:hypothetical protein